MRIALIGGGGFIGHHLALRLREDAHDVLVLDHLSINSVGNLYERRGGWNERYLRFLRERADLWHTAGCDFALCDAKDYHRLSQRLASWKPDAIVQLAAVAHITHTRSDEHSAWANSVGTLKNALDAAVALKVGRFVYFSSSTIYGNFSKPTVTEDDPAAPDTTYGAYKLVGELMVKAAHRDKGLPYTIIRPQALYGPRCVSRRVTQLFIENALDGKPLRIDGDGSAAHDFTHVADLVGGVAAVFQRVEESENETFCLTAGQARTLKDLAEIVRSRIPCEIQYGPPDPEKPSRGTMSIEKAQRLLGWTPKYNLETGMGEYCDWYKEMLNAEVKA